MKDEKKRKARILVGYSSSNELVVNSFKEIIPKLNSLPIFLFVIVISFSFSLYLGTSQETVTMFRETSGILSEFMMAIFGIIFTVFAIFQALLTDDYLNVLLDRDPSSTQADDTFLSSNYAYLEHMLAIYFFVMAIDLVITLAISTIPDNFVISSVNGLNNTLAVLLLTIYFSLNLWVAVELKSIIYNVSKLFRIFLMSRIVGKAENNSNEKEEGENNE